jgi:hypothetical protein
LKKFWAPAQALKNELRLVCASFQSFIEVVGLSESGRTVGWVSAALPIDLLPASKKQWVALRSPIYVLL